VAGDDDLVDVAEVIPDADVTKEPIEMTKVGGGGLFGASLLA